MKTQGFTRAALMTAGFVLAALQVAPSFAAAPLAKTNAPGFYRIMLGDFEVTVVNDGTVDLPVDTLLQNVSKEKIEQTLAKRHLKSPLETTDDTFLINTGTKLVLIDTGAGTLFGPTLGKLVANLKASGYQPEQVDEIYITHMHPDHVGGLTADGKAVFPNAVVRADKKESDYWLSDANAAKAPDQMKGFFQGAKAMLTPYVAAGKLKPFEGATELVPGVKAVPSPGHTPGHTTYVVESKGQKLVLVGDMIHVAAVQFPEPNVVIGFDTDSKSAEAERQKEFAAAAKGGYLLAAAHLPFPSLGHLAQDGKGYEWIPVNYTLLR